MMHKPDLLVTWIKHCDYPIFRKRLRENRDFFGKVIIYWSEHFRHMYFDSFIQEDLKDLDIQFLQNIEYKYGVEDWRNISTNYMLQYTTSDWLCSVEQDFFARDWKKLLDAVTKASESYDLIGYKGHQGQENHQAPYLMGNYVHPAFWFMKREALEKTTKNFSADTTKGCDHFGLITREAEVLNIPIYYLQDNGFEEFTDVYHQGGINMNYLESKRDDFSFHRPELFYIYNWWSMHTDVKQNKEFMDLCRFVNKKLSEQFPEIDPELSQWRIFYETSGAPSYVAQSL